MTTPAAALRACATALAALADVLEHGQPAPVADLVTLDALPVSVRVARRMIHDGSLPAVRRGRAYLVARADAERVFAPTAAAAAKKMKREPRSERDRIAEQLARAGVQLPQTPRLMTPPAMRAPAKVASGDTTTTHRVSALAAGESDHEPLDLVAD